MKLKSSVLSLIALLFFSSIYASCPCEDETSLCCEEVRDSFGYGSIGLGPFPLPIPSFCLGYRTQRDHFGYDLSLQTSTIAYITQVKGTLLFPYYFRPNPVSEFYAGGGIGVGGLFETHSHNNLTLSPEFVFGKQYISDSGGRRFFQCQVSMPTFSQGKSSDIFYYPLLTISYGVCF